MKSNLNRQLVSDNAFAQNVTSTSGRILTMKWFTFVFISLLVPSKKIASSIKMPELNRERIKKNKKIKNFKTCFLQWTWRESHEKHEGS